MTDADEAERFRRTARYFSERARHPAVSGFPALAPLALKIDMVLNAIDLDRLHAVPTRTLTELTNLAAEATDHVQFTIDSHPPQNAFRDGVGLPQVLEQNPANINSRRRHLEKLHEQIFHSANPIITHQQMRLLRIAAARQLRLDAERSISAARGNEVVWRYMPLENLLRCERAGGLWFSSLQKLRAWATAGAIADIREGDIPPVVQKLKSDYWSADAVGQEAVGLVLEQLKLTVQDLPSLRRSVDFEFELTNTFVSSWCRKRSESSGLWPAFADNGRGVALKSTVAKLLEASWHSPLHLSGAAGANRITALILRDVQYLEFDDSDPIPSIDDLHLPLLKRETFSDEHEVRLVAFTEHEVPLQGFILHCNLHDLITEIVVGPNGDFNKTAAKIRQDAPDLAGIPMRQSQPAPVT